MVTTPSAFVQKAIAAGIYHTLAVQLDGTLICFGHLFREGFFPKRRLINYDLQPYIMLTRRIHITYIVSACEYRITFEVDKYRIILRNCDEEIPSHGLVARENATAPVHIGKISHGVQN